jgi:hypothetical protein
VPLIPHQPIRPRDQATPDPAIRTGRVHESPAIGFAIGPVISS